MFADVIGVRKFEVECNSLFESDVLSSEALLADTFVVFTSENSNLYYA